MPHPRPQSPEDDAAYFRAILHDLIDQGAKLAHHVYEATTAATPTPENRPEADPTLAFDRIARCVRRSIALARMIAADPALNKPETTPKPNPRTATRARLIRAVEDAIHRKREQTDSESLYTEFAERLDDPELELDLQNRPVADLIEEICRDLGVATQARSYIWKRRTPAEVATLRARAATPPKLHLVHAADTPPPRRRPHPPS